MSEPLSRPLSAADLCDAMRRARSFDTSHLNRLLRVDEARGLVEVQASATWRGLAAQLRPTDAEAAAVRTTMRTVGESISRNAAGPDGRPAVIHVESLTLVTPDGELRRASRVINPELFALAVGGQGLFGALYSVTLRIESLARAVSDRDPATGRTATGVASSRALQLLVPPQALEGFVAAAQARCAAWRVAIAGAEVRRTRQEDDTFLRWARRDYFEVGLHLASPPRTLGGSLRAVQLRQELIDAAIAAGGAFQISCTPEATHAQTETCYPELKQFIAAKRRFDREERLVNAWYCHQRSLLGRERCHAGWLS